MNSLSINDLSILIVEPSMTSTRFIGDQLKNLNVRNIECCDSGAKALASMRRSPPDLLASSMYLPDMTATDLIEIMRTDPELDEISFMLVSTETSFAKLDPIRQAGIVAILPKPFSRNDLRKALIGTTRFIESGRPEIEGLDFGELKVLVVDDSLMARKHIGRVLKNLDIENITEAENGSEAVEILERNFFDLVITDYNMPEMDGEELTRYIRVNGMQRSIPILMVTSEENGSRLAAVQQAGVSGICDKPFDTDTLMNMIQEIRAEQ